jgi:hypothetical protein
MREREMKKKRENATMNQKIEEKMRKREKS